MILGYFLAATAAQAQVQFKTIFDFNGTDGVAPQYMFLIQATDGNFYGTTTLGGQDGAGTVFKITPSGQQSVLYNFCINCPTGSSPYAGVVQATDGNFYGTTYEGGNYGQGTVFKITPAGELTSLYSFCLGGAPCVDGNLPTAALVQGSDGNLYGTTTEGGAFGEAFGGTLFRITLGGTLTTLYSFGSGTDGNDPFGGLVEGTDGNLYGTTAWGGANGWGTVYRATLDGAETVIYNFCPVSGCADGSDPDGPLVQGVDGSLYGTTRLGGTTRENGQGTVFKITLSGNLTTLYRFCEHPVGKQGDCPDSGLPIVGLTLASNGYLAGTTGGAFHRATIFGMSSTGSNFEQYTQANNLAAGLLQGTNGLFYGMAGTNNGSIFSLGVGLGTFIKTIPTFGPPSAFVTILGANLKSATSVTFNGIPTTFTVVSASEITTNVPTGATTGRVKVITSGGTLTSNLPFAVTP
jgi:uncharacterized repeat protein (TIGR03803 family)